jgi:short-subunit dehydrogenase
MTVVILGATKGIGRAVARRLAARGDRLCLLGRDEADLERSARDLEIRAGASLPPVAVVACDLARPDTFEAALDAATAAVGPVDVVVVTAAEFATQEALESDRTHLQRLLTVNFSNTVVFCEDARRRLLSRGGTLCVVSSVAGERARKPVILYGAAKAGLSHYLEGLDHKFRQQGLKVVCVKPGFVKTGMTVGLRPPPFAGEPEAVARDIVRGIDRGTPVVYTPRAWALVMLVIRALPRAIMRRIEF